MSDPLFTPDPEIITVDPNKDYFAELVGEGKKFADAKALARSKAEADAHIARLEREQAIARKELENRMNMEKFMDQLSKTVQPKTAEPIIDPTSGLERNVEQPKVEIKGLSEDDVTKMLEARERQHREQANIAEAIAKAKEAFGANYAIVLKQKAQELGVSEDFLTSIAKSNVAAFVRVVGIGQVQGSDALFPQGSINTSGMQQTAKDTKNWAYYENIRKNNVAEYLLPKTQREMHEQAVKLGESFYN